MFIDTLPGFSVRVLRVNSILKTASCTALILICFHDIRTKNEEKSSGRGRFLLLWKSPDVTETHHGLL